MNLNKFLSFYKQSFLLLLVVSFLGLLGGIGYFYAFPPKYVASGSFFVGRTLDTTSPDFKYEGYYASLNSLNFVKSVVSILESDDLAKLVLDDQNIETTRKNLRDLKKGVSVTEPKTQVVTLKVKTKSEQESVNVWNLYRDNLTNLVVKTNKNGDGGLYVTTLVEQPFVTQTFSSIFWFAVFGLVLGFLLGIFVFGSYFFVKENLKNEIVH